MGNITNIAEAVREHPRHPAKELALQLAVSARESCETPKTTVDRARVYAEFLSTEQI